MSREISIAMGADGVMHEVVPASYSFITEPNPVYYKHFNYKDAWNSNKFPCFTLAYRFLGTEMEISVARCSRGDTFVKAKGREIALERLMRGDSVIVVPPRVNGKLFHFPSFMRNLVLDGCLSFMNRKGERDKVRV